MSVTLPGNFIPTEPVVGTFSIGESAGRPRPCREPRLWQRRESNVSRGHLQIAPSASAQIPSSAEPEPRSAIPTGRPARLSVFVRAVNRLACESASTSMASPRMTTPLGNHAVGVTKGGAGDL